MKFKKLKSSKSVDISVAKYLIDWKPEKEVSKPQGRVKKFLFPFWKNDFCLEEFCIPGSRLRCDVVNISKRIIVEISPTQHFEFNKFFHGTKIGFLKSLKRDVDKKDWAEDNNFTFIEIIQEDLDKALTQKWFEETYKIKL